MITIMMIKVSKRLMVKLLQKDALQVDIRRSHSILDVQEIILETIVDDRGCAIRPISDG